MVKVDVNGEAYEISAAGDTAVVDILRDELRLTGTKLVCGSGVCGACTVLLDGAPVVSCLLPVRTVDGRRVGTVESLAEHPVARAFSAHNALQCGYCTPGFVVEAAAFHDRRRAAHGGLVGAEDSVAARAEHPAVAARTEDPAAPRAEHTGGAGAEHTGAAPAEDRDAAAPEAAAAEAEPTPAFVPPPPPDDATIAAELSGHLCRCGAYPEIYAAVRAACEGAFDAPGPPAGPRVEAAAKVTGRATYTTDVLHDGQLEGRILRSPHSHARVVSVDLAPALEVGARAAISMVPEDGIVRYVGQEVAAVAALDRESAERALAAIGVVYEPLPAVIGLEAARAAGAPEVYALGKRKPPSAAEGVPFPAPWHGNIRGPIGSFSIGRRKVRRRLAQARVADGAQLRTTGDAHLVEGVFHTAAQLHTTFEPHVAIARFDGPTLTVHVSTQAVTHLATLIAERFGLRAGDVRVVAEHVGGGFGAKLALGPETVAAVRLAREAGVPVRVMLDRLEELSTTGYRPPGRIELALLADADANLRALRIASYTDAGVAVGNSTAGLARLIYPGDAKELLDFDVVTNLAPGSPFRGPGGPLMCFALEQAVDEAASRLGRDPIALRQRWDSDPLRGRLYRWAAELPPWQDRAALPRTGRFRRGIGMAAANWFYFWEPGCSVSIAVSGGRLVVSAGVQDMGTGSRSVLANVVARAFGLEPAEVEVRVGDSRLPHGPMSGGSRTTATIVPAALDAVARLQAVLTPLGGSPSAGWRAAIAKAEGKSVSSRRSADDRRIGRAASAPFSGAGLVGASYRWMLRLMGNLNVGRGYTSAVHVVEVEVDTRLGRTRVLRVHAGIAAGRLAAAELAAAQARGGVIQGIGFSLYEGREVDPHTGLVLSANLEDYRIPGIADTPEIDLYFEPGGFEHVPGHGVGLGEVSTLPVAAAVANAVHDATGVRPYELPIRPDRLLEALS